ncbi:MAG: hypothetical protein HYT80_09575 [Euryarchaeota archaeon]|nr:hypothetical protein [Euryarchaeota archaeon]
MFPFPSHRTSARRVLGDVAVVLGAFLAVLPALTLGSAAIPAAEWERERRDIEAVPTADGFSFRSTRDSDHGHDELIGNFQRSADRFQVGMVSHAPPARLVLNLTFVSLYEFRDLDEDGGYTVGDEVVSRIRLRDIPRSAVLTDVQALFQGGYVGTVTYPITDTVAADPAPPGTFVVRFFVLDEPRAIDEASAVPSAVHAELRFEDFPFHANDTRLALEIRAEGSPPLEVATESLRAAAGPFEALIAWNTAAAQGTQATPVHVAILELAPAFVATGPLSPASVLFSYPQSDAATSHATSLGFRRPAETTVPEILERFATGDWRVYTVAVVGTVALLGVTLWRRVRSV